MYPQETYGAVRSEVLPQHEYLFARHVWSIVKNEKNIRCALLEKWLKKKKKSLCFMYFTLPLLLDTKFSLRYFNELLTYAWPSMQPFVPSPNNPPYKWLLEGRSIAWLHKKQLCRRLEYIQFVSISIRQNKNLVGWVKKIL